MPTVRKPKKETQEYIPEYAICYIEYGDASSLNEEDIENIDNYLEYLRELGYTDPIFSYDFEDINFLAYPPFGKATNCVKTTITQIKRGC